MANINVDITTTLLGDTDTPNSYVGEGGKFLAVKADESGTEFKSVSSDLTIDTTPITGGSTGYPLYHKLGNVVGEFTGAYFDTVNNRVGIGYSPTTDTLGAKLDIKAQGTLSTDIVFRIRNSGDSQNLLAWAGNGTLQIKNNGGGSLAYLREDGAIAIGYGASTTNHEQRDITIGYGANISAAYGGQRIVIGNSANSSLHYTVAIGVNATTNSNGGVAIGYGASTAGGDAANPQVALGMSMNTNASHAVMIGASYGAAKVNTIANSFMLHLASTAAGNYQHFFVNSNTNLVMKSNSILSAGTEYEVAATNALTIHSGVAPVQNINNASVIYSAEIATNRVVTHFLQEDGRLSKVYQDIQANIANAPNTGDANTDALIQALKDVLLNLGLVAAS